MFRLEVLTPDGIILEREVDEVIVPGQEGYFGVRTGHTYFMTGLQPGKLTAKWGEHVRVYVLTGGVVQVTPEKVVICAERADLRDAR